MSEFKESQRDLLIRMQDVADGAELPLCVLEPSNWIFLAVGLPNSIDLSVSLVVTSLPLFDDHGKSGAGG